LIAWPKVVIGQLIKRYERRRVVGVERRLKRGSWSLLGNLLDGTQEEGGRGRSKHGLHGAIERDLPREACSIGAPHWGFSPPAPRATRRDVPGRDGLQLLLLPCQLKYYYERTSAHPSDGRRANEPSLEHGRGARVSSSTPTLAASEAAWATIEGHAATHRSVDSMTTVKRPPTPHLVAPHGTVDEGGVGLRAGPAAPLFGP
jgi:hypothetical protein